MRAQVQCFVLRGNGVNRLLCIYQHGIEFIVQVMSVASTDEQCLLQHDHHSIGESSFLHNWLLHCTDLDEPVNSILPGLFFFSLLFFCSSLHKTIVMLVVDTYVTYSLN